MMYPYITLADDTLITHSHLMDKDGVKTVEVHFERPVDGGFDFARCRLPSYEWIMREGFSDKEIERFETLLHNAAHSFYRYAETGGLDIAKVV
ncbi:MAG: hypothetical protein LBR85_04470 [Oscillospiraceae bacterium]|nr:hypothetical protein [Oscillospiraceae bacterium]